MILSHKHQFIYIKTYKTASSSIEAALTQFCGPDDVVTPTRRDLMEARQDQMAQNYRLEHPLVPKKPFLKRVLGRPERRYHPSVGYYEHIPAWRIRQYVGESIWNSYYKFTFERNPWDRQVSYYFYKVVNKGKKSSFENFMNNRRRAYVGNFELYSDEAEDIIVDFVGRYESLETDLETVMKKVGLPVDLTLPNVNVSNRSVPYRSYYNDETQAIVAEWYRREIELFGYSY